MIEKENIEMNSNQTLSPLGSMDDCVVAFKTLYERKFTDVVDITTQQEINKHLLAVARSMALRCQMMCFFSEKVETNN